MTRPQKNDLPTWSAAFKGERMLTVVLSCFRKSDRGVVVSGLLPLNPPNCSSDSIHKSHTHTADWFISCRVDILPLPYNVLSPFSTHQQSTLISTATSPLSQREHNSVSTGEKGFRESRALYLVGEGVVVD